MIDDRLVEVVQALREEPVEVDQDRIALAGLVIAGLDQSALKFGAIAETDHGKVRAFARLGVINCETKPKTRWYAGDCNMG